MTIAQFTDSEQKLVKQLLAERYGHPVELDLADVELQLDPSSTALTDCPALYWKERGAEFIVCKTGESRYRCQFMYSANEQFGTGREVFDDLLDCIVTVLRVQADHEGTRAGMLSGTRAAPAADTPGDDYDGPLVI
jgi:hypothetical protein